MDQLNQRQIGLFKLLISDNSYKPIKEFAEKLQVSNKTISSDLKEIQLTIQETGVTIKKKTGCGIKLAYDDSQLIDLIELLNNQDKKEEISVEQRRAEISRSLLLNSKEYTTIQKLADKYYVSRTSILNDLKYIEGKFSEFNINIIRTRDGTRIQAKERDIRNALVYVLKENIYYNSDFLKEYQVTRQKENNIEGLDEVNEIKFFGNLLNSLESEMKRIIYEPYYTNLLTHLLIMTKRVEDGNKLEEIKVSNGRQTGIDNKSIFRSVTKVVDKIEQQYNIDIPDNEVLYIYQYLISSGSSNYIDQVSNSDDDFDVMSSMFTRRIMSIISDITGVNFNDKNNLYQSLLLHIKPMLNRLSSGIRIRNPLLDDIRNEFRELLSITSLACKITCDMLELEDITIDEVAYIMTYFQFEVEKSNSIKQAIVICHSGYGTSQLLATRLRKSFANINVCDVISSSKIESVNLDKVDLIVSTVKLNIEQSYILVSAFLSETDKKNIQNLIENQSLEDKDQPIGKLENVDVDSTFECSDMKEVKSKVKNNYFIDIDKNKITCINETTCIYISRTNKNQTLLYKIKNKEAKSLYLINYGSYNYLVSKIKEIMKMNQEDSANELIG